MNRYLIALLYTLPLLAQQTLPPTSTAAELEQFLLPAGEDEVRASLDAVFSLQQAGAMVTAVARYGPLNARRAAEVVRGEEFRQSYLDLADYLDRFGPCQKKAEGDRQGWWSGYGDSPGDAICSELVKLMLGTALWNQVEYCRQLSSGEVAPKTPVPEGRRPPYRLDEAPVATAWIKPAALYELAGRALAVRLQARLRERRDASPRLQRACLGAAALLEQEAPNREAIALALAQLILRNYQVLHLGHLEWKTRAH